jgi:hypothetical protein
MFKCLPRDADVVIWAYTVEILSLREGMPEKQSVKRGIATWARVVVNEKAKREKKKREGKDMAEGGSMTVKRMPHCRTLARQDKKTGFSFIYYVTNSNILSSHLIH